MELHSARARAAGVHHHKRWVRRRKRLLVWIDAIGIHAVEAELRHIGPAPVLREHDAVRARPRLLRAERLPGVFFGVNSFGKPAVGLDAIRGNRAAVVGNRHRNPPRRIEHDLIRRLAVRAHFVQQFESARLLIDREGAHGIAGRVGRGPVHRIKDAAVGTRPHVRRIHRFRDEPDRRERAGLRIEPPRVNALRCRGRFGIRVGIGAHVQEVVTCPERRRGTCLRGQRHWNQRQQRRDEKVAHLHFFASRRLSRVRYAIKS